MYLYIVRQDGTRIAQLLAGGYTGYAQLSRIVGEWLILAKTLATTSSSTTATSSSSSASSSTQDLSVDLLAMLARHRFSPALADKLIDTSAAPPLWLQDLLLDPTYRSMLIELYDQVTD